MADADTLKVVDEFASFVRPVRHPQLTAFCTELTSITQAQVDAARAELRAAEADVEIGQARAFSTAATEFITEYRKKC